MDARKTIRTIGLGLVVWAAVAPAAWGQPAADLSTRLAEILVPESKATLGARVVSLDSGEVLFDHHSSRPMIPASNMKLVVMAASIDSLGVDYQYPTVLAIRGTDLVVIGSGDPCLGDEKIAERDGQKITHVFETWAARLKELGVEQIPGNIVIDDSVFDESFTHANWPDNQYQKWYEAPIGGLNFNSNCVAAVVAPSSPGQKARIGLIPPNDYTGIENNTTTGPKNTVIVMRHRNSDTLVLRGDVARQGRLADVCVRDPGMFTGSVLKDVLNKNGIPVGGKVVREKVRLKGDLLPNEVYTIAVHYGSLDDALQRAGKNSLGMVAEGLFKTLGYRATGVGTWESGASAINSFFSKLSIPANQVAVDDGSGLSRKNRLSAAAAIKILANAYSEPAKFELLRESLAVAGEEGTLRKRLRGSATKGRIFAKTGTIAEVRTLAGYIKTESDEWLAFAFFYNNLVGKAKNPKPRMDNACQLLVEWQDPSKVMQTVRTVTDPE